MHREELAPRRPIGHVARLLAVFLAGAEPATGQERERVGLVAPETVCRVAPSHSADAAGLLKITGEGWFGEVWVNGIEADETGEMWIHAGSRQTARHGIPHGCWVPESAVAPTEGAGHLLELADRLLSGDAWPPLEHFVAVHNLFVHPMYREQLAESAVFGQRRTALLAKAVEAAQRGHWLLGRPVDRDPLVLAWMESLGQRVRYSEDPWGRGTWTAVEGTVGDDAWPADSQRAESATPREGREMAVIAPDVACRVDPRRTGRASRVLEVDYHFRTHRADTAVAGESWVDVAPHGCWVPAAHAAPADTDEHVLTISDRFVTSGEAWSFDNRVRLYTVLSSWNRGHRQAVEASAILGLRRLQVLRMAIWQLQPGWTGALTRAWIASLGQEVALTAEGHAWTVSDEAYLALYEKHRTDPFAEEILWKYASESDAYSCEGDVVCAVKQAVNRRLAAYWTDFPGGRHIPEAVESGRTVLGNVLERCRAARATGPDSGVARGWDWWGWDEAGPEIARELIASLEHVSEEDKAPLIGTLVELQECAAKPKASGAAP